MALRIVNPQAPRVFKTIANITIGGSGNNDLTRGVNMPSLERDGWISVVRDLVQPTIDLGFRRIMLGNPFGMLQGRAFEFDQYIHAREGIADVHPPLPWLYEDFVEVFNELREHHEALGDPIELIAYIGTPDGDPEFTSTTHRTAAGREGRRNSSISLLRAAGFTIYVDAVTALPYGGEDDVFIRKMRDEYGIDVAIEGWPSKSFPRWADFPVIATEGNYDQRFSGNADWTVEEGGWGVLEADVANEIKIIWQDGYSADEVTFANAQIALGHTAVVPPYNFISGALTYTDIVVP